MSGRFARSRGTVVSRRATFAFRSSVSRGRRGRLGGGGRPSLLLPRTSPLHRGRPVGLTLSILLSRLGVDSQLVERRAAPTAHPQAALREHPHEETAGYCSTTRHARSPARTGGTSSTPRACLAVSSSAAWTTLTRKALSAALLKSRQPPSRICRNTASSRCSSRARSKRTRGAPPGSRCAPSASGSRRTTPGSPPSFDSTMRTMREMVKSTVKFTVVRLSRARRRFAARS